MWFSTLEKLEDELSGGCFSSESQQGLEQANLLIVFLHKCFGFEGFPPFLQGQKAFHAVTRAHVRGGIYSAVKAEWEHSAPCAMALAVKSLFLFLQQKFIIHSVAAMTTGNLRMCTDQMQEEKLLRCADIGFNVLLGSALQFFVIELARKNTVLSFHCFKNDK